MKFILSIITLVSSIKFFIENFNAIDKQALKNKYGEEEEYIIQNHRCYLKKDVIEKFNSYIKICKRSELIDKNKYPLLKKPKISIIIPLYNGGKYLNYSLRTIQNQDLKEIEIIIIDDCSTDDSLNKVEKLMSEEPRIRLIKNYRQRRILYSKSIAALNCNGDFILELDQDDMFIRGDLFDILYNEAIKYNLDLVQFRDFIKEEFYFKRRTRINFGKSHWIFPKRTFYMEKNELKTSLFKDNNNYLLWGMLINSNLYKKAMYNIWELIINYKIIFNEDYFSTTMILMLSNNYKYLEKFGIIHLKHKEATSYDFISKREFHLSNIIFPIYLNNYFVENNPKEVQLMYNYINLNKFYQTKASLIYPRYFEFNIRNLLNNNYLLFEKKNEILDNFNIEKNRSEVLSSYSYIMKSHEFYSILNFQNSIINKNNLSVITEKKINLNLPFIYVNFSEVNFSFNKIIKLKYKRNRKGYKKRLTPKISIIIYCNQIEFLEQTINSIIEQKNFFSFEIIIIFDNFGRMGMKNQFQFNNIYIINNHNPKGIMYSFLVAINFTKGKYILQLQSGYTLAKKDVLIKAYNKLLNANFHVLELNMLINKDENINSSSFNIYICKHFKKKHDTNEIKYKENNNEIEQKKELLINKLIKTSTYKDLIYKYKLDHHKKVIYNYFDDIIIFFLSKRLYKFRHSKTFGIIKNINSVKSLELNKIANNIEQKRNDSLFYINFLFEHSSNNYKEKKLVYEKYINILSLIHNKFLPESNKSIKLLNKFLKCEYINEIEKLELIFFYNSLKN